MNKTEMLTPENESESVGEILYKHFSVPGHLKDATRSSALQGQDCRQQGSERPPCPTEQPRKAPILARSSNS